MLGLGVSPPAEPDRTGQNRTEPELLLELGFRWAWAGLSLSLGWAWGGLGLSLGCVWAGLGLGLGWANVSGVKLRGGLNLEGAEGVERDVREAEGVEGDVREAEGVEGDVREAEGVILCQNGSPKTLKSIAPPPLSLTPPLSLSPL